MKIIKPGQNCLVIGSIPESGKVVTVAEFVGLPPGFDDNVIPWSRSAYRITNALFLWLHKGKKIQIPYCCEKFLQPLPDLPEETEIMSKSPLDEPVVFG